MGDEKVFSEKPISFEGLQIQYRWGGSENKLHGGRLTPDGLARLASMERNGSQTSISGVDSMNERTYCMLLHFSVFAGYAAPVAGLIVPIVLWQLKKDEMPSVDAHGKMVLNFILSSLLYGVVFFALIFAIIGIPLLFVLSIVCIIFPIIGGVKAYDGVLWQYPLIINFVK